MIFYTKPTSQPRQTHNVIGSDRATKHVLQIPENDLFVGIIKHGYSP